VTTFVDSSAFYAAADQHDQHHERATVVLASGDALLTTDHVLTETWTLIAARAGHAFAERFWGKVRDGLATVEPAHRGDLDNAWRIGEEFADQEFSLVDRTSFAVMERLGITRVASFDSDFAVYRFGPRRSRAVEVLRSATAVGRPPGGPDVSMIRAARMPALRALSRPTAATGTPGGICTTERIASSPPAAERRLESGTPITGRSVWAATTPGSAAERPAPAISTRSPRARAARA
jgi:predicted nucleic acid-binding protein